MRGITRIVLETSTGHHKGVSPSLRPLCLKNSIGTLYHTSATLVCCTKTYLPVGAFQRNVLLNEVFELNRGVAVSGFAVLSTTSGVDDKIQRDVGVLLDVDVRELEVLVVLLDYVRCVGELLDCEGWSRDSLVARALSFDEVMKAAAAHGGGERAHEKAGELEHVCDR
jgi:hypothetical protein